MGEQRNIQIENKGTKSIKQCPYMEQIRRYKQNKERENKEQREKEQG